MSKRRSVGLDTHAVSPLREGMRCCFGEMKYGRETRSYLLRGGCFWGKWASGGTRREISGIGRSSLCSTTGGAGQWGGYLELGGWGYIGVSGDSRVVVIREPLWYPPVETIVPFLLMCLLFSRGTDIVSKCALVPWINKVAAENRLRHINFSSTISPS